MAETMREALDRALKDFAPAVGRLSSWIEEVGLVTRPTPMTDEQYAAMLREQRNARRREVYRRNKRMAELGCNAALLDLIEGMEERILELDRDLGKAKSEAAIARSETRRLKQSMAA